MVQGLIDLRKSGYVGGHSDGVFILGGEKMSVLQEQIKYDRKSGSKVMVLDIVCEFADGTENYQGLRKSVELETGLEITGAMDFDRIKKMRVGFEPWTLWVGAKSKAKKIVDVPHHKIQFILK